jgi:hypothetical protein
MSVVDRVRNILLTPKTEWHVIAGETTPPGTLVSSYVVPLAGAAALADFLSSTLVGLILPFFGTYRTALTVALGGAIISFVMAIVAVYVLAMIVNALAPNFGSEKSERQSFKLAVYTCTPIWIAGVLSLIPLLGILSQLLAVPYAIYLLYLGLGPLMKTPSDKAAGYTLITFVVALVLAVLVWTAIGILLGAGIVGNRIFGGFLF